MRKLNLIIFAVFIVLFTCTALTFGQKRTNTARAAKPQCSEDAVKQARKLLAFHSNNDERIEIDDSSVKALPSFKNPANARQKFDVIEVWGYIYKGQYRMRLIYYVPPKAETCVLMGQEILEHANP